MINLVDWAERGRIPDVLLRVGMRRLLVKRLVQDQVNATPAGKAAFVASMRASELAVGTTDANHQHYEVPTAVFQRMLGPRLKYSCALYEQENASLAEAEEAMLKLTCERAQLGPNQQILELGCGWGSLTLFMAEAFPDSNITAVSNAHSQRQFIEAEAQAKGLTNITVLTQDMNNFEPDGQFDRVVSIEMFEHMRNYQRLLDQVSSWLVSDGLLFFHIFCHRNQPYFFEDDSQEDWMARHFFTGGLMPSLDLPKLFEGKLQQRKVWVVNGQHYAKTCATWLHNLDQYKAEILKTLTASDNPDPALILWQRWRMFVMACQEMFAFQGGETWMVGHFLFEKTRQEVMPDAALADL
jgi:cyclopropane-fatty-acyl-phospholipid synthase